MVFVHIVRGRKKHCTMLQLNKSVKRKLDFQECVYPKTMKTDYGPKVDTITWENHFFFFEERGDVLKENRKLFLEWKNKAMENLCKCLLFLTEEVLNITITENTVVSYMNGTRISIRLANISRELIFPNFKELHNAKMETKKRQFDKKINWVLGFESDEAKKRMLDSPAYQQLEISSDFQTACSVKNYMKNGYIMHNVAGRDIMNDIICYENETCDIFIPGRIISIKIPPLAATPDFCILPKEMKFDEVYGCLINNGCILPELKQYTPLMWAELKTIQKLDAMISDVQMHELLELLNIYKFDKTETALDECKKEAVKLLTKTFQNAKWMELERKKQNTLFLHKNKIVSADMVSKAKKRVEMKKLKYLFPESGSNDTVSINPLVQSGKAWILIYENPQDKERGKCLQVLPFEKAPFLLGPNGSFYKQVLEQVCCVQYFNFDAKHLFVAASKYHESKAEESRNNPCLVYAYEVIIPQCVRCNYEKSCFKIASHYLKGLNTPVGQENDGILDNIFSNDEEK